MITKEEYNKKLHELINEAFDSGLRELDISTPLVSANISVIIMMHEKAKTAGVI